MNAQTRKHNLFITMKHLFHYEYKSFINNYIFYDDNINGLKKIIVLSDELKALAELAGYLIGNSECII